MVQVVVTVEVKSGKRDAFLAQFARILPAVRAENGCIEYGPSVDLRTDVSKQAPLREDVVVILEKWESLEALLAHLDADHMKAYRERVKDLVAGSTLHILEPAA